MKYIKISWTHALIGGLFFMLGFGIHSVINSRAKTNPNEEKTVYAVVDGEKILGREVLPKIKEELKQLQKSIYNLKKRAVEEVILEKKKALLTSDSDGVAYTPEEFKTFLQQRNLQLKTMTKAQQDDLLNNFKLHIQMLATKKRQQELMAKMPIEWEIPMDFLEPAIVVEKGSLPALMKSDSLTSSTKSIVVFANYHCAYCPETYQKILALQKRQAGKVNLYFRFAFAEPESSIVYQSAVATVCAQQQGQFEHFFKAMFERPPLESGSIQKAAEESGLDQTKFKECLSSPLAKQQLDADLKYAEKLDVLRAPVLFVNGHSLQVQEALGDIEAAITQP